MLFVEAFGKLSRDADLQGMVSEAEEDLYSVFRARAELMGWSTLSNRRRPLLWNMNEAELTAGIDESRIGWAQVGLDVGDLEPTRVPSAPARGHGWVGYAPHGVSRRANEPALILPALVQCFDDALRRFGVVELTALQVSANFFEPRMCSDSELVGMLNWFNTASKERTDALITLDPGFLGGHTEEELVADLQQKNTGSFKFGPVVAAPEQYSVKARVVGPVRSIPRSHSGLGVSVALPEWTAGAAGWALAVVIDAAGTIAPDVSDFAVRIERVK